MAKKMLAKALLLIGTLTVCSAGGPMAPVVIPQKPTPFFSWDTIPTAFHGANKSGVFTDDAIALLAQYQLVTFEKWYTPCGSQGPHQSGPECDVEAKIEHGLGRIKAINKNVTTIMYLNSMLDFAFYHLHGVMLQFEANGQPAFLRDINGKVVALCNDGNVYCNITTFDWTKEYVRDAWLQAISNATATGMVDGIFADHSAQEDVQIGQPRDGAGPNQLCNGKGAGRTCATFSTEFKTEFNSWHLYMTNKSQDMLSKSTGGPVICGPEAHYGGDGCSFDQVLEGNSNGDPSKPLIYEVRACNPDEKCLAAFLAAAEKYTYLTCFAGGPTAWPEQTRHLGEPDGPAKESFKGSKQFTRTFSSGVIVFWDNEKKTGNISWPGIPPPSPPPPPAPTPPISASCGKVLIDTGMAQAEIKVVQPCKSTAQCCSLCQQNPDCKRWSWHTETTDKPCHLHTANATPSANKVGAISGILP